MLTAKANPVEVRAKVSPAAPVPRITSTNLLQDKREIEIEHAGKIYRLRITQLNKLILTA